MQHDKFAARMTEMSTCTERAASRRLFLASSQPVARRHSCAALFQPKYSSHRGVSTDLDPLFASDEASSCRHHLKDLASPIPEFCPTQHHVVQCLVIVRQALPPVASDLVARADLPPPARPSLPHSGVVAAPRRVRCAARVWARRSRRVEGRRSGTAEYAQAESPDPQRRLLHLCLSS